MTAVAPAIVFVSGASSGFGQVIAQRFAKRGSRVIAAARRLDRLSSLADEYPKQIHPLFLDVRDPSTISTALASLPPDYRAIDCLINNAGLAIGLEPAPSADVRDWQVMVETNCFGLAALSRAVLPGMIEQARGHVVNIGSVAGSYPYPGGNVYGATKAFVHQFSLNLRSDLAGTGVRVTSIEPGMCGGTEFSQIRFRGDDDRAAAVYKNMKPLMPEDIADAVEWASSAPPHVNINRIELMPTDQSFGPFAVERREANTV